MTEPAVVGEILILVDAEGNPTEDRNVAVGGEVVEQLDDGTARSTTFEIDRSTDR